MKKLLLFFMLCLPIAGIAKDKKDNSDPKYLAGAVTLTDGKVSFTKDLKTPGQTKSSLFKQMKDWADGRFKPDGKMQSRVVYSNEEEGDIAVSGEEYLVFSSSALSLDRTRIYYQLTVKVMDGQCKLTMNRIRYWYDETRDGGEKYAAEEWITDDMALNKKKTKLAPICGKFRRETIDLKDAIFSSAASTLGLNIMGNASATNAQAVAVVPTVVELNANAELKSVDIDKLPSNLNELAEKGRITLTSSDGEEIEIKSDNWLGVEKTSNKNVAYLLIDKSRIAANALLEQSKTYKVSFYAKGSSNAVVVIDCKKMTKKQLSAGDLEDLKVKTEAGKTYIRYVGEVTGTSMR